MVWCYFAARQNVMDVCVALLGNLLNMSTLYEGINSNKNWSLIDGIDASYLLFHRWRIFNSKSLGKYRHCCSCHLFNRMFGFHWFREKIYENICNDFLLGRSNSEYIYTRYYWSSLQIINVVNESGYIIFEYYLCFLYI